MLRYAGMLALLFALLSGELLPAQPGVTDSGNGDWPHFGNSTDQTRYSLLTQVSNANVSQLGVAWSLSEGPNLALWETFPVVVHGVMYLTTGTDAVYAVHADTGTPIWSAAPRVDFSRLLLGGAYETPVNRGVEVANGTVYLLTFDDQLIAYDSADGKARWHTTVASAQDGYTELAQPTYWQGMLFVGSAQGDSGARGFVAAYAASTGRQIWRFYTVPQPGHGWVPAQGHHGGGDVWMPPTIDSATGTLFIATGNPSPDFDNRGRPGCNPWTDALVALDARTGRMKWARTLVCPDLWDYDADQSPLLLTLHRHGEQVRAVGVGVKDGRYWIFEAATGTLIAVSPPLGASDRQHRMPTQDGVMVCPGKYGGLEYSPPSYSPSTGAVYLPGLNMCMIYRRSAGGANRHAQGTPDLGGTTMLSGSASGFMAAVDAQTGKIRWRVSLPKPAVGGSLATAGNLVFSGDDDGRLYAFDARTGRILWKPILGLTFGSAPISYQVGGTQYIAVAAGGSSIGELSGHIGGTLVVFKLHGGAIHRLPAFGQ